MLIYIQLVSDKKGEARREKLNLRLAEAEGRASITRMSPHHLLQQ